jgi:hypothetical protein
VPSPSATVSTNPAQKLRLSSSRQQELRLPGRRYRRINSTTSVMMKPTVIVVHMITWRGTVHASLGRLVLVAIRSGAAARVPSRRRSSCVCCAQSIELDPQTTTSDQIDSLAAPRLLTRKVLRGDRAG